MGWNNRYTNPVFWFENSESYGKLLCLIRKSQWKSRLTNYEGRIWYGFIKRIHKFTAPEQESICAQLEYVRNPGTNKEKKGRILDGQQRLLLLPVDHAIIYFFKRDGFLLFSKTPDNITNETNSPFTTIQLFLPRKLDATKLRRI